MSKTAISIQNLSKEYLITKGKKKEVFKALNNINLEIEQGKVTGLIGPNGAGKSTLLKILSRITYPTSGQVVINGRLASLLEVGTGFHPELSGRENIFLNGAILGMSRAEIKDRFDEIVDFSGVEDFLDTPVKRYSSGMYVRLAFSVAAHLRSEVLLIDEVLAVGDAEFQKKCLGKMDETTREAGRTIIFVSHNLKAIRELCEDAVWIDHGQTQLYAPADEVCSRYLKSRQSQSEIFALNERTDREGAGEVRMTEIKITSHDGDLLVSGRPATFNVFYKSAIETIRELHLRLNLISSEGIFLTSLSNVYSGFTFERARGTGEITCKLEKLPLLGGTYTVVASLFANGELQDRVREAYTFEVSAGDFFGSGLSPERNKEGVEIPQKWSV